MFSLFLYSDMNREWFGEGLEGIIRGIWEGLGAGLGRGIGELERGLGGDLKCGVVNECWMKSLYLLYILDWNCWFEILDEQVLTC